MERRCSPRTSASASPTSACDTSPSAACSASSAQTRAEKNPATLLLELQCDSWTVHARQLGERGDCVKREGLCCRAVGLTGAVVRRKTDKPHPRPAAERVSVAAQ